MGCCRSKDFVRRNAYKPEKQTPLADKSPEVKMNGSVHMDGSKIASKKQPTDAIHEDHIALDSPGMSGRAYTFSNNEPVDLKDPLTSRNKLPVTTKPMNPDTEQAKRYGSIGEDVNTREFDSISNEHLTKLATKGKVNMSQLDGSTFRGHKLPVMNNDTNSELGKKPSQIVNGYEPVFHEKKTANEFYFELNEAQLKRYEDFAENNKLLQESMISDTPGGKNTSGLTEWTRVIQKHINMGDRAGTQNDGRSKMDKVYKAILALRERSWYDELVGLYKERNISSKHTSNMNILTFERKTMTLQEHFRWLIYSIANVKLNFNKIVGAREFPPVSLQTGQGAGLGGGLPGGSETHSEVLSPSKGTQNLGVNPNRTVTAAGFEFDSSMRCIFARELPDAFSGVWLKGFIWKGVYLKLYTKKEGQKIKREMKALKHLAIEYLQTESMYRIFEGPHHSVNLININESFLDHKGNNQQTLQVILPLISVVESSSWVLLGTPIFPCKKGGGLDENIAKILQNESNGLFKSCFLLSGATASNFKTYHRPDEMNIQAGFNTFAGNYSSSQSSSTIMLCNAEKLLFNLPKVNVLFVIGHDENINILFTEYPKKGYLDFSQIKKMTGYSKLDVSFANLKQRKSQGGHKLEEDQKEEGKPYAFEVIKFKRMGWSFNMIHLNGREVTSRFPINRRATELLAYTEKYSRYEIRGNVIVFGHYRNSESMIHPYFISDSYIFSSFVEPGFEGGHMGEQNDLSGHRVILRTDPPLKGSASNVKPQNANLTAAKTMKFIGTNDISARKDSHQLNASFCLPKLGKEEKIFVDYFISCVSKSIEQVCDHLDCTDKIYNFEALKEAFHKKGLNMRFEWIVFAKIRRRDMKEKLGVDILVRTLKRMLEEITSKKLKQLRNSNMNLIETAMKRDKIDEKLLDKNEFFLEHFFKRCLAHYASLLMKGTSEASMLEDSKKFFSKLTSNLFLSRLRAIDMAKRTLDLNEFDSLMSSETLKDVLNLAYYNAHIFIDAIQHHFNVCLSYDIIRQVKNDKFAYILSLLAPPIRHVDISVIFQCDPYLTLKEKSYLLFLKLFPASPPTSSTPIELNLPSALYKLRKFKIEPGEQPLFTYDCFLREYYELPDIEVLNDWVVLLESALNGVMTIFSEQNFLMDTYILQILNSFFLESDDQGCLAILDKINLAMNTASLCSPELTIITQTLYGILYEPKHFVECEQNYMVAILTLHKLYGDPRGRGGRGTPWELFITWRLSILSRLQGKIHDAEYVEELYDATLMTLKENTLNRFYSSHYVYSQPFHEFLPKENDKMKKTRAKSSISYFARVGNYNSNDIDFRNYTRTEDKVVSHHPFSYWTSHLQYDENSMKFDVINQTLPRNSTMLKWMVEYMPLSHSSGIVWETSYLKEFFLSVMQNAFSNSTSVSSLSNYSVDGQRRDKNGLSDSMVGTPKSSTMKMEKKQKKGSQGGNLVQVFEKDASTVNKREAIGVAYSWGQNFEGQTGYPTNFVNSEKIYYGKKMRSYFPKAILTLKDTIVISVSCGHSHTMALTLSRRVLAWGSNKSGQLGLGNSAPEYIFIPVQIPDLENINLISCGTEHTVALAADSKVYSWGQGEGGLLGHKDTMSQMSPKVIVALNGANIVNVVCGGLHTLAINKQGHLYSWGRGEGGQLGLPLNQITHDKKTHEYYLTTPTRIRGALDGQIVVKIAAGDAHSLALTQNSEVYGWGYTNSGQLGLGVSQDNFDPSSSKYGLQVMEPVLIDKLKSLKIVDIFAGSMYSLFMTDKKELYGCGLNDYNQIGIGGNANKMNLDNYRAGNVANYSVEISIPKKLECFNSIPIMKVACGENHSLALALMDKYCLFSWGMQRHAQLGNGDAVTTQSAPRPISYLQDVMIYSMACGAFHSVVVLGDPTKVFKEDNFLDRCRRKVENQWNILFIENGENNDSAFEAAMSHSEQHVGGEEGKK